MSSVTGRVVIAIAASTALVAAILFLRQPQDYAAPGSQQPVGGPTAKAGRIESNAPAARAGGGKSRALFERPEHYEEFDFQSILRNLLEEAARGSAEAQFRASVMLRDCPSSLASKTTDAEFAAKGLGEDHIALIRIRTARCSGIQDLIGGDAQAAGLSLAAAALQQGFPIAEAENLVTKRLSLAAGQIDEKLRAALASVGDNELLEVPQPSLPADKIDAKLLEALASAGDDRVLRSEAFFLVIGAMGMRSNANGMESDPIVENAWSLLHCRESWDCDLDATLEYLSLEMPASSLKLAIDLAAELDLALKNRDFATIRMY